MAIKRRDKKRAETRALELWSQELSAASYIILRQMFDSFLADRPRPWKWGNTPGQPLLYLTSLRHWARRWAKELALTPAMIRQYLKEEDKPGEYRMQEQGDWILWLLSDKEAGENE